MPECGVQAGAAPAIGMQRQAVLQQRCHGNAVASTSGYVGHPIAWRRTVLGSYRRHHKLVCDAVASAEPSAVEQRGRCRIYVHLG